MPRPIRCLLVALLTIAAAIPAYGAATDQITVNVTFTIAESIDITWSDAPGTGTDEAAQTWAAGSLALNQVYTSTGTVQGTAPTLQRIKNNGSNASVDISAVCGNSASWSVAAAAGANAFMMEANVAAGAYTSLHTTTGDFIDDLASNAVSGVIGLRLSTPTSITVGGGLAQSVAVTFTAAADNGD